MPLRISGIGPNPKQLHFMVQVPNYGVERLSYLTVCHHKFSPEHTHTLLQALWVLNGELLIKVGDNTYALHSGMLIVLPAGLLHQPLPSSQHPAVEMLDLRLFPPLANYLALKMTGLTGFFSRQAIKSPIEKLTTLCSKRQPADAALLMSEIWMLLSCVGSKPATRRRSTESSQILPESTDSRIHAAEAVMRLYLEKPLSIKNIAEQVNLSSTHLTRLFLQARHMSPGVAFRKMRLERSAELLGGSCLSVKEIAERCGFTGVNQFVRAFGREFGVSPGLFRKKRAGSYE